MKYKNILVTGATSFVGAHVVPALKNAGYNVTGLSSKDCDLRYLDEVRNYILNKYCDFDCIVHLAARVAGIGGNINNGGLFFYENLMMGANLIEAARELGIPKVVNISTVCSYPAFPEIPFKESSVDLALPEPTNLGYGLAKRAVMHMGQLYQDQYNYNVVTLLITNMIGSHDNFNDKTSHVCAALIKKAHCAKVNNLPYIEVWSDGSGTRDFCAAPDAARAVVSAIENYDGREPINVGGGREVSIRELAETIMDVIGYKGEIKWLKDKPVGQQRRFLDISRAKKLLNWEPTSTLREMVSESYNWYLENVL